MAMSLAVGCGHMALGHIPNGTEVWLVHHRLVASSTANERRAVLVLEGPVLVQRLQPRLADLIVAGHRSMRVIGSSR